MAGNPFDAQDLTQETFLSAYQKLEDFDGEHERAWIVKIASNKCLDYLKSASRRAVPTEAETFAKMQDSQSGPEQGYLQRESREELLALCQKLSPPYDEIALSHFWEEKTAKEISEEKGRNLKTVQTQIYRAKAMLKKLLEGGRL